MDKVILMFLIVMSFNDFILSQNITNDTLKIEESKYVIFLPSDKLNNQIKNGLRVRYALIRLRVHPLLNLNEEQYKTYSKLLDTIQNLNNVSVIDSVSISLKSGISWNITDNPPPQPKKFYIKAFTKKGKEDIAVMDRIKYLQFCHAWMENDEFPREMVDKFNSYYAIVINGVKQIEMSFEIKFDQNGGTKTTRKKIIIHTN